MTSIAGHMPMFCFYERGTELPIGISQRWPKPLAISTRKVIARQCHFGGLVSCYNVEFQDASYIDVWLYMLLHELLIIYVVIYVMYYIFIIYYHIYIYIICYHKYIVIICYKYIYTYYYILLYLVLSCLLLLYIRLYYI